MLPDLALLELLLCPLPKHSEQMRAHSAHEDRYGVRSDIEV